MRAEEEAKAAGFGGAGGEGVESLSAAAALNSMAAQRIAQERRDHKMKIDIFEEAFRRIKVCCCCCPQARRRVARRAAPKREGERAGEFVFERAALYENGGALREEVGCPCPRRCVGRCA